MVCEQKGLGCEDGDSAATLGLIYISGPLFGEHLLAGLRSFDTDCLPHRALLPTLLLIAPGVGTSEVSSVVPVRAFSGPLHYPQFISKPARICTPDF